MLLDDRSLYNIVIKYLALVQEKITKMGLSLSSATYSPYLRTSINAGSEGFEPSTWRLGGVRAIHFTPYQEQ